MWKTAEQEEEAYEWNSAIWMRALGVDGEKGGAL